MSNSSADAPPLTYQSIYDSPNKGQVVEFSLPETPKRVVKGERKQLTDSKTIGKGTIFLRERESQDDHSNRAAETGTTRRALSADCDQPHYLLGKDADGNPSYNRFDWWSRTPPMTGAITIDFPCEFSSALTTIVGTDQNTVSGSVLDLQRDGYTVVTWNKSDTNKRPHELPALPFHVRTERPISMPVLRTYNPAGRNSAPEVLINELEAGTELTLGAEEFRPAMWFDFVTPQRAVGLEYGYKTLSDTSDFFDRRGVRLTAFDKDGREIITAFGREDFGGLTAATQLLSSRLDHLIGVRDQNGRISSVRLEFTTSDADQPEGQKGRKVLEPQVVSRVWFEPLPPAAVKQGLIGFEIRHPLDTDRSNPFSFADFSQTYDGQELGNEIVNLHYRFDRALVFLRGFRLEFLDSTPYPLKEFKGGLSQDKTQFDIREEFNNTGDVFISNRKVVLSPEVALRSSLNTQKPFRGVAYYTLVGWDSAQVSLSLSEGTRRIGSIDPLGSETMFVEDRCGFYTGDDEDLNNAICGPLFGALRSFDFNIQSPTEVEQFYLWPGFQRGFTRPNASIEGERSLSRYPGGGIGWTTTAYFDGTDHDDYDMRWKGAVLTGKSLTLGPDDFPGRPASTRHAFATGPIPLTTHNQGPRRPRDDYYYDVDIMRNDFKLSWPVLGDVAFLGLNYFSFSPDGDPVQQMDFELRGVAYDGRTIDWEMGMGINTLPIITNSNRKRSIFGVPTFGALRRNTEFAQPKIRTSEIYIHDGLAGCANSSRRDAGFLENTGDGALLITDLNRGSDLDDSYFKYYFTWRGMRMTLDEIKQRMPLQVRPGEILYLKADYEPPPLNGRANPLGMNHSGRLLFQSSAANYSQFVMTTHGFVRPGTPRARWVPERLDFGPILPGQSKVKFAGIVAEGEMPLCVKRIFFKDESKGFYFEYAPRVEGDVLGLRVGCNVSRSFGGCQGTTDLLADTNAGRISLPISANVIINEPPPVGDPPPCENEEDVFRGCQ